MAEEKEKKGEVCHISICKCENGWKISCMYNYEKTLSQRAGWTPCGVGECKDYVAATKAAVLKRLEEIM